MRGAGKALICIFFLVNRSFIIIQINVRKKPPSIQTNDPGLLTSPSVSENIPGNNEKRPQSQYHLTPISIFFNVETGKCSLRFCT